MSDTSAPSRAPEVEPPLIDPFYAFKGKYTNYVIIDFRLLFYYH